MVAGLTLLYALSLTPAARATELRAKGIPLSLHLPAERWEWEVRDHDGIELWSPARGLPRFEIIHQEMVQPDLDAIDVDRVSGDILETLDQGQDVLAWKTERAPHPTLGQTLLVTGRLTERKVKADLRLRLVPAGDGLVGIAAFDLAGSPSLDRRLDEILDALRLDHPALPREALPYGHVALPAGYELDLPEGWRALRPQESEADAAETIEGGQHKRKPAQTSFVDTRTLLLDDGKIRAVICRAKSTLTEPLQLVDPAKNDTSARNLLTRLKVMVEGGTLDQGLGWQARLVSWSFRGSTGAVKIDQGDPADVQIVPLADRGGFLWRGTGTQQDRPVSLGAFYTSWDDLELYCLGLAPQDEPDAMDAFEAIVRSLRVTDAAAHPMRVSLRTEYVNWWPWTHPLLQLYWIPVVVLGSLVLVNLWWNRGSDKRISLRG